MYLTNGFPLRTWGMLLMATWCSVSGAAEMDVGCEEFWFCCGQVFVTTTVSSYRATLSSRHPAVDTVHTPMSCQTWTNIQEKTATYSSLWKPLLHSLAAYLNIVGCFHIPAGPCDVSNIFCFYSDIICYTLGWIISTQRSKTSLNLAKLYNESWLN